MSGDLLKVMIVDDEHLVRDLLKRCIDWAEIGYEVAGEASCAQEAMELIEKVSPDVIFTDICMPYMDGIEFARVVFEKYPLIKIIILTGYEEFEYAKRSIKVGIADFLLKPINDDEIRKAAVSMKEKIESERTHRTEYARLKKYLEENLPYLREKLLNELLQTDPGEGDLRQRLRYFHIDLGPDGYQVAVIEAACPDTGGSGDGGEEEKLLLRIQCMEMVRQYFREDIQVYIFSDNSQRIVVLNGSPDIELTECLEAVKTMLVNRLKCFVSIGVGNRYPSDSRVKDSYKEACNALEYKVVAGKNQVIGYRDLNFSSEEPFRLHNDQLDSLAFFLRTGMKGKAVEFVESVFSENSLGQKVRIESIRAGVSSIVSVVLGIVSEAGIPSSEVFGQGMQPFEQVFKLDTVPELRSYVRGLVMSAAGLMENLQNRKVNQAVRQVQEYMLQNLQNSDLSLSTTAKAFYMNVSYLSRIFKQETGQTFVEYLTRARMEKAIRLIRETGLKAYEIAGEVGIEDPHYFGICFKKYAGMSVNDFKRRHP